MANIAWLLAIVAFLPAVPAGKVTSLVGDGWTLSSSNGSISVPAHLPSQAHLDLYANGVIGNPYHNLNDFALRWVVYTNWTYTSDPIEGLSNDSGSTWLQFDGLDTFASISFCGKHVANTNNQFRQWWYDVSDILASCSESDRKIAIEFGSAPLIANQIANEPGQETWPFGVQQLYEFNNRWFIRKEQSDFGWDWGPAFAPAGPWQPAYVVQLGKEEVHVRNILVDITRQGQTNGIPPDQSQPWVVNASVDYFGTLPDGAKLSYVLKDAEDKTVCSGSFSDVNMTGSTVAGMTTVGKDEVDLWWPSQLGPQNLYYMTISVDSGKSCITSVTKRVGFRTIVLNQTPISEAQLAKGIAPGNNWHFEVNGHEFYAKGSNFIPPDAFWPRVTPERIEQLFDSVIDGNQNMLRVWASGAYSPDFMYDIADEKGILLWSEFEFGDALYPVNEAFLDNVREEVDYQVRRCNHHPSLALWAGGNELESLELILVNDSAPGQFEKYKKQYETLFIDTIGPIVFGNSRSISYTPTSTGNGYIHLNVSSPHPLDERFYNVTPGHYYSDTDFYNYDPSVLGNDSAYPVGRFSNEFGYHSMPSLQSWQSQVSADKLSFNSSVVFLRDHHDPAGGLSTHNYHNSSFGQAEMTEAVELWYPVPDKTDALANFSAWCWATQVFQADLYKSEIEFYRRGSGRPERQLGSLYWQLEDIWVAPTWAGIEYSGRWKILHSVAQSIYSHIIIAAYHNVTTGHLSVSVTSDLWDAAAGTATLNFMDWNGSNIDLGTPSQLQFDVGALNSTEIFFTNLTAQLDKHNYNPEDVVLQLSVTASAPLPNSSGVKTTFRHQNWFSASSLKTAKLQNPGLQISHSAEGQSFNVTATTAVAAWVWIDYPAGAVVAFDSNAFWLAKGESQEVGYKVKKDETNGSWVDGVEVRSMWDQTQP